MNQLTETAAVPHRYTNEQVFTPSSDPVVVFIPIGNTCELRELGRYKNVGVAMAILSNLNHPDSLFPMPEYHIFSTETGARIYTH